MVVKLRGLCGLQLAHKSGILGAVLTAIVDQSICTVVLALGLAQRCAGGSAGLLVQTCLDGPLAVRDHGIRALEDATAHTVHLDHQGACPQTTDELSGVWSLEKCSKAHGHKSC